MMGRSARLVLLVLLGWVLAGWAPAQAAEPEEPAPSVPEEVTVEELLAHPEAHTGGPVVVRGELVGDFGVRRDGTVWVQLNDDPYVDAPLLEGGSLAGGNVGLGARIPADLWPGYEQPGGYGMRGPVVELTGMWRYHDPERGGESYLDVTGMVEISGPRALPKHGIRWLPLGLGCGLLALAGAVGLAARRRPD